MAITCITNHKLFDQFVSNKKKIIPQITDDWELNTDSGGKGSSESVNLYSKKIDQNVFDISFRHYLDFIKEHDVVSRGGKIEGEFIIGTDRKLYAKSQWQKLQDKINRTQSDIIPKNMWKRGCAYKTECGSEVLYLGQRYVIREHKGKLVCRYLHFYCDINSYDKADGAKSLNEQYNKGGRDKTGSYPEGYFNKFFNAVNANHVMASMKFVELLREFDEPNFDNLDRVLTETLMASSEFYGFSEHKITDPVLKIVDVDRLYPNNIVPPNEDDHTYARDVGYSRYNRFEIIDLTDMSIQWKDAYRNYRVGWRDREGFRNKFTKFGYIAQNGD